MSAATMDTPPCELLILTPMHIEAWAVRGPLRRVEHIGVGLRRAAASAARIDARNVSAVAVMGVAGALGEGLAPGTLVVADRLLDHTGQPVGDLSATAPLVAAALRRAGLCVRVGPIVSTPRPVRGAAGRAALASFGAVAVDMESAALMQRSWERPFAVVRAIADTPGHELLSPSIVGNGWAALAALRATAPVLGQWAGSTGARRVLLAGPRSFCAGVERAIETVERALERFGAPVFVRRQIVHNRHVVADLEARGAIFVHELDEVPEGATVVFSAHGVAPAVRAAASGRDLRVIDATCPLVSKVHSEVRRFRDRGYQVVLIGHDGHDETEGTLGEAPDVQLVSSIADVDSVNAPNPDKVAYITQTTLAPDDVATIVAALEARFPTLVGPHAADICYATQNRQEAVTAMARDCDLLLVVGSRNSSNTARLAEVAQRAGCRAEVIDDESEIDLRWLEGAKSVGVTAGASAPESLVQRVVSALGGLGPLLVEERSVRAETVSFPVPVEVR
jgi:4-hydroxy-3-methylbut-2-enyl diphosphate reductase